MPTMPYIFLGTLFAVLIPSINTRILGSDVVFVILSQSNEYHAKLASEGKMDILNQTTNGDHCIVHLSHEDFPHVGAWTIIPLIPLLDALYGTRTSFIVFLEDRTRVKVQRLLEVLEDYHDKEAFLGFGLHDKEPSIIHHFAFYEDPHNFKYPNLASGFVITTKLLNRLSKRIRTKGTIKTDFNIDSSHELALFIWNSDEGQKLTHTPDFCITDGPTCATYAKATEPCGEMVPKESIYFAVKTCAKFHKDRVPVVKTTWARHAKTIKYFSDTEDRSIPTISLGIKNTDHGHCEKTFGIIRHVAKEIEEMPDIHWLFIADDDTILSVSGLQSLLSCYNSSGAVALGERYGYGVHDLQGGYNYITGGGGMVFSRPLLMQLADPNNCECPAPSSPDDMYLGFCLKEIRATITHSPLFHQARPADYAEGYLKSHSAVSFHKHWMVNPVKIYNTWFADADSLNDVAHTEL